MATPGADDRPTTVPRKRVAALHPLPLFLLAAWLGAALLAAAVVAPAAFAVLPTRALAGALVGRVLPPLFVSGAVTGLLVVAATRIAGRRARAARHAGVAIAALTLVAGCLVAQLVVTPRIERIRDAAGVPIDALAPTDARRVAFGRLHGLSVLALGVSMLAGAAALAFGARGLRPVSAGDERDELR